MSAEIDHIGIAVRSIDATLAFYQDALGVDPGPRIVVEHEKVEVAMLPLDGPRFELFEATSEDSVIAKFIEKRGEGLHHVALLVPDLAAAVERIKARGARLVKDRIQQGAEGYKYVFVHPGSAGGVLLELIERDPGRPGPGTPGTGSGLAVDDFAGDDEAAR